MAQLTSREGTSRPRGWLAGLDGLRAVAVLAVMVFHFAPALLPGGFLGVDLFFAISGYLITRLLVLEIDRTGRLDLLGFYRRRWQRLVPAAVALLVAVMLAAPLVWRDELTTLRQGVLASAGFVTNWWLIFDHQSYFVSAGRPPMVEHLWSLAIEEQFYVVWPVLLALLVGAGLLPGAPPAQRALTRAGLLRVAAVCAALGVASAVTMTVLAVRDDVPYGTDSARVYLGTDTHASALLFGAALGALSVWRHVGRPANARPRRELSERAGRMLRGFGLLGSEVLAVGALALLTWQAHHVTEFDPALYRGGLAVISVLAAVLVAAMARERSLLGRLFDVPVLRWIGQRSYAMYLWHWPVAVVTRPGVDVTGPRWLLVANQIAITVVLAAASYRFVEQPFRTGAVSRWLAGPAQARRRPDRATGQDRLRDGFSPWRRLAAWGLGAACLVSAVDVAQTSQHPARAETAPERFSSAVATQTAIDTIGTDPPSAAPTRTGATPAVRGRATPSTPARTGPGELSVSAFGDSVMLGAAPALLDALPELRISAERGSQARSVFADVRARQAAGTLAPTVVIHTGSNGIISPDDLRTTLRLLNDRRLVVLLTARVPREWQGPDNSTIRKVGAAFGNARVLDWYSASNSHPSWFYDDGLHLRPAGAAAYAALIRAGVQRA